MRTWRWFTSWASSPPVYASPVRLFVVRHAEAAPGEPDHLRPLTGSGRTAAKELGERLVAEHIDAVISSPLVRARETAAAIAKAAGLEVQVDDRLGPGATADDVRAAVAGHGDTVVTVGHQPDCSELVLALSGHEVKFKPAGVHEVEL
jgi:phosphohistidine phosphatase SixA